MNNDRIIKLRDGRKLGYSEYGDPNGKPIFYFHGWPVSRLSGCETNSAAKKLRVKVISPDRPGYGLSDYKKDRTLLDWASDVTELADILEIKKFAVIGVSGGGPYAAACAYKIPERLTNTGIVVGIAPTYIPKLLDNMPFLTKFGWAHYARSPLLRKSAALMHFINAKYGPSLGLHRFLFGAKKDRQAFSNSQLRSKVKKDYQEAFRNGYKGVEQDLKLYTTNWGFELRDIKTKVYLWYGAKDENVPLKMGEYYKSQKPNSELFIDQNGGHLFRTEHEEEILKKLVEF